MQTTKTHVTLSWGHPLDDYLDVFERQKKWQIFCLIDVLQKTFEEKACT